MKKALLLPILIVAVTGFAPARLASYFASKPWTGDLFAF